MCAVDALEAHQRAQDAFAGVLVNVESDQFGAPTPCSEWTVADLIEHVLAGNEHVPQRAGVQTQPAARPSSLRDAHRATAAVAHQTFAGPNGLTAMFDLPFGRVPGSAFIGIRSTDLLTHAWDLAVATGQPTDLDPELARDLLAAARQLVGPAFRGPGGPFGAEQACPPDRPAADQLAAFLGRRVD